MASMGDEARDFFDDEEDDDDSQFDSDDDYPHHPPQPSSAAAPLTFPAATSLTFAAAVPAPVPISAAPQFIPTPNPNPTFSPLPLNGAAQALHASYTALTAPELLYATPSPKRQRSSAASTEDPRRVFQKLWTDEDEINLLQGFLDFTTQRGTTHADYQYDTGPFFDQIRTRLQLDFHKNQLVEKLRRLKRKYRTAVNRINSGKDFKTAHDRATFEISQKIWNSDFKRERKRRANRAAAPQSSAEFYSNGAVENHPQLMKIEAAEVTAVPALAPMDVKTAATGAPSHMAPTLAPRAATSVVEETVKSCLLPVFKELLQCVTGGSGGMFNTGLALNPPVQLSMAGTGAGTGLDERWKQQQILELEVFLKRTELVQEQIKSVLEELKSTGDAQSKSALEEIKLMGVGQSKSAAMEELGSVGAEQSSAMEETGSMVVELAEQIKSAHEELGAIGSEQRSL